MKIVDLGVLDFAAAFAFQERLLEDVVTGVEPETLLLLEHPPVYTIGRGGNDRNMLDNRIQPLRINRGGDVTYHGPGQLIGYPIINLGLRGRDLHRYLRFLEEVLVTAVADFDVNACRVTGRTGIWTEGGKLASIGVGVRRWITMHGFALNVSIDLAGFAAINPCGIVSCPVTSLEVLTGGPVPMPEVKETIRRHFVPLLSEWLRCVS